MEKIKKLVEEDIYVAVDGKEFDNEKDCTLYEMVLKHNSIWDAINKLKIDNLEGMLPLGCRDYETVGSRFHWYLVNNDEEFNKVIFAYNLKTDFDIQYPEVVCVEVDAMLAEGYSRLHFPLEYVSDVENYLSKISKFVK